MRVLITVKSIDHTDKLGGTETYYKVLRKYFSNGIDYFNFSFVENDNIFSKAFDRIRNSFLFLKKCLDKKNGYDLVHLNPSLSWSSVIRDGYFLVISKWTRKKTIIFFRGWHDEMVRIIDRNLIARFLFKWAYNKSDVFIVLSKDFKDELRRWGFKQKIYIETTVIDNALLNGFKPKGVSGNKTIKILFLARIEKEKGVYETIDAYSILKENYPKIQLTVAGDGNILEDVKQYVEKKDIKDVIFTGYVYGDKKSRIFSESDIYVFPTSHGEGMPNSVLEAIAFGLPVVTRSVGGLRDFFENEKMGYITDRMDEGWFADSMEKLINNEIMRKKISQYNSEFGKKYFIASQVSQRLERIYNDVLSDNITERSWQDEVG